MKKQNDIAVEDNGLDLLFNLQSCIAVIIDRTGTFSKVPQKSLQKMTQVKTAPEFSGKSIYAFSLQSKPVIYSKI